MAERLTASVHGGVQMVGFRAFTQRTAYRLRLVGYVRNRPDGAVQVVAEGPRPELERLLGELRIGPPGARVEAVDVHWEPASGEFRGFLVRH